MSAVSLRDNNNINNNNNNNNNSNNNNNNNKLYLTRVTQSSKYTEEPVAHNK